MTLAQNAFFPPIEDAASVDAAIGSRVSVRAYSPRHVDPAMLEDVLRVANRAPSGTNTQPWRVYVLEGPARDEVVARTCDAHNAVRTDSKVAARYTEWYDYYPIEWASPFIERRRENGIGLYTLLGIGKGDKDAMHTQQQRNFHFFDAPVGLIFTIDQALGHGALLDYGMFLQNIMMAARARGLHTCPQAAWIRYADVVMPLIGAQSEERLVCGMALGWADEAALVNAFRTPRESLEGFVTWVGA